MEAAGKGGEAARAKDRNIGNNPEECSVCLTAYDETVQRPRTLPCGHTFCTLCINELMEQGQVTCPECRVSHSVPKGGQFPVSYALEAVIRRLRDAEPPAAGSLPPSAGKEKGATKPVEKKEATGLSKKMRSFLQEQEATVVAAITTCQEVQSQLDQYQTTLTGWGEEQQQLEDKLQGLIDQSRSARVLVQQEKTRAAAKKEEMKLGERQLQAALETLHTLTTELEAGVAVTEVFRCTDETEQVMEECRESFPDADTVTTFRKMRMVSNAALEAVQAVQAALEARPTVKTKELIPQSHPASTIMDRLQVILPPSLLNLNVEDLRNLMQPARSLLEAGRVFAVHQVEGQRRHARISLEGCRFYLHALKDNPPPHDATTLQVIEVAPPSPPCLVFLDLAWPGSSPRRVLVRLSPDTPGGRQFLWLCTGQRGPSYANTRLFGVGCKGQPGEWVEGGDYESNDGSGGAALLPHLDKGEYRQSCREGAVWGWWDDPSRGAQFGITTSARINDSYVGVFGELVEGLDCLTEAAHHGNIAEVTIVDCGVVLWE